MRLATELRFETALVNVPSDEPLEFIHRLGEHVAPYARELAPATETGTTG